MGSGPFQHSGTVNNSKSGAKQTHTCFGSAVDCVGACSESGEHVTAENHDVEDFMEHG